MGRDVVLCCVMLRSVAQRCAALRSVSFVEGGVVVWRVRKVQRCGSSMVVVCEQWVHGGAMCYVYYS